LTEISGALFDIRYRFATLGILSLVAVAAFDAIAVVAALPSIGADLGHVTALSWVVTSYLIASTMAIVVAGRVIDTIGARASFRSAITIYAFASFGCALAPTFEILVAFRALQGVGGGFILAVTLSAIGLVYPEEIRPRAVAANSIVWGFAALIGPATAAVIVTTVGWRGVFACSIILGALAGVVGWNRLPDRPLTSVRGIHLRPASTLLLGSLVVTLVLGLSHLSLWSLVAIVATVALAAFYWRHSGRTSEAVLERRYFGTMPFAAINVAAAASFGAALGLNSYLPVYVRAGLGASTEAAAFSALYLSMGWTLASVISSRLVKKVPREMLALAGNGLVAVCILVGLLISGPSTRLSSVFALFFGYGVGVGLVSLCLLTLVHTHAESGEIGRATAAYQFARTLGYSCGAGLTGGIVLFVVSSLIGDAQQVRPLLSSETGIVDVPTREAVAIGFRIAHLGALSLVSTGVVASLFLQAWSNRGVPDGRK
jgi:MFS family permease